MKSKKNQILCRFVEHEDKDTHEFEEPIGKAVYTYLCNSPYSLCDEVRMYLEENKPKEYGYKGFVVKLDGFDLYEGFQHSENVILSADNETIPLVLEVLPYIDDETEEQYIVIHYRELLNDGINLYEWALAIKGDCDFKVSA